ncbi:LysR family transcriptional regulator [Vibrio hepatarius]|uniref:LysR family transcriptional regulator n=1 Tax=Vibrio hepatarius TaxID=171383 RepID=UPI001C0872A0|nr:LysR family transcriptional regulator [Vibrio hepatarius]MBU2895222.1 LysR family transcriptional regulator [Vibrio hepatarius]
MENMKRYCIFSVVAESESMTAASKKLGMSPSAISQNISLLEESLGVTLIYRSTRGLSLSEAGRVLASEYKKMHSHFCHFKESISDCKEHFSGTIKIATSCGMAQEVLSQAFEKFIPQYPQLNFHIIAEDELRDAISEGVDIAIRIGKLKDSNLVYRPAGELETVLVASQQYLDEHGMPLSINDLEGHLWLRGSSCGMERRINEMLKDSKPLKFNIKLESNNIMVCRAFAIAHQGVTILPRCFVKDALQSGQLITLLPDIVWPSVEAQILTASRVLPRKVKVVIDHLKAYFKCQLSLSNSSEVGKGNVKKQTR